MIDSISLTADAVTLSPVKLFMDADIIVKMVMVGLVMASIWTWTIIIGFGMKIGGVQSQCDEYEKDFWAADDTNAFYKARGQEKLPTAKVLASGIAEWRRSVRTRNVDREGTRQRLATAMNSAVSQEVDSLSERLNFLATVGSVAPFVGLFGTVWGIMRSFTAIAAEQNSSLAVVAPGIAEALFATAIGLFAAIPAVIAYNRFSHRLNRLEARLFRFTDRFHGELSRELETEAR